MALFREFFTNLSPAFWVKERTQFMFDQILLVFVFLVASTAVLTAAASFAFTALSNDNKRAAEINLLDEQANHISQTAAAEEAQRKDVQAAYEKQGQGKLRTELARLAENYEELEKKLGFKIVDGVSRKELDRQLQISRDIIAGLEARLDQATPPSFLSGGPAQKDYVDQVRDEATRLGNESPDASIRYRGEPSPGTAVSPV